MHKYIRDIKATVKFAKYLGNHPFFQNVLGYYKLPNVFPTPFSVIAFNEEIEWNMTCDRGEETNLLEFYDELWHNHYSPRENNRNDKREQEVIKQHMKAQATPKDIVLEYDDIPF